MKLAVFYDVASFFRHISMSKYLNPELNEGFLYFLYYYYGTYCVWCRFGTDLALIIHVTSG
jgi:hypothetical protein